MDMENHTLTERNLLGNWVLLYFGYTSSPDVGPEQLQMMAKATNILGWYFINILYLNTILLLDHWRATIFFSRVQESRHNRKILPVFVTLDPQRDTPSHLRAYLKGLNSSTVEYLYFLC